MYEETTQQKMRYRRRGINMQCAVEARLVLRQETTDKTGGKSGWVTYCYCGCM